MKLVANFIAFQLGWFSCVLGAAHGRPWLGPLVVLAIVLLHLFLSSRPMHELRLIASAMLLGLVIDSLLLASGWLQYPNGAWLAGFAPYWIIAMWALFATTLNVSMRWIQGRTGLAVLLGSIGGPLSYLAGQKMGAISFLEPTYALLALAAAWGLAMPLLAALAAHFDGVQEPVRPDYVRADWRVSDHV
jgi:hypothetical protein